MGTQLRRIDAYSPSVDRLSASQQERFRQYLGEILSALALDVELVTAFPLDRNVGELGTRAQVVEEPILATTLCEYHAVADRGD